MLYVALLVMIALAQYLWFTSRVGSARQKYGVSAPETTGNPEWERLFRVQQNTMEQLVVYIPALLAFGYYLSEFWALIPGALFIVGRQIYAVQYARSPENRVLGMVLTFFSNAILVLGGLVGIVLKLV